MRECLNGADYVENMSIKARELIEKVARLQRELKWARNELCSKCGKYSEAHNGSCDGCRFRFDGEWRMDIDE